MSVREPGAEAGPARDDARGAAWLLADMSLNVWALSLVKLSGGDVPAAQMVFLRAVVGLVVLAPWLWAGRAGLRAGPLGLHLARVGLSATALGTSFYAIAQTPFALFTAIGFTRPLVTMAMAALFLSERITGRQGLAGLAGLVGVIVAVQPMEGGISLGVAALALTVLAGSGAVIVTRRMRDQPLLALMLWYTGGLALVSMAPAALVWRDPGALWPQVLAVGVFAQAAQACFLRAHYWGAAGVLAPLGYLSLPLSAGVGYAVFAETPTWAMLTGAAIILAATLSLRTR